MPMSREEFLMYLRLNSFSKYLLHINGGQVVLTAELMEDVKKISDEFDFVEDTDLEKNTITLRLQPKADRPPGVSPFSFRSKYES